MKTLLIVFIHGFMGDEDTFRTFPQDLKNSVRQEIHGCKIITKIYPKYQTSGDLKKRVVEFRNWLESILFPSNPPNHVVLVGHSMGGIIGAETLILMEQSYSPAAAQRANQSAFPYMRGLIAFDTPFLGINPCMLFYRATNHCRAAAATYISLMDVIHGCWNKCFPKMSINGARQPQSQWSQYFLFTSVALAAVYSQRKALIMGWDWLASHCEFICCLLCRADLRHRMTLLSCLQRNYGVSCAVFYNCLGLNHMVNPSSRTFCNIPEDLNGQISPSTPGIWWIEANNGRALNGITAHMNMFSSEGNENYETLLHDTMRILVTWVSTGE